MNLDQILSQLTSMHPHGQRPANPAHVRNLNTINITREILASNSACTVCQEDFKIGEQAKKLQCDHCFHEDCIMPWLRVQNTCPVCRSEV